MKCNLIELKNVFVHEDLYYHFLIKFSNDEWENLDKQKLIEYIKEHIPSNPEKEENDYYTHEYYIVLSHIHNNVPFDCPPVYLMQIDDFRSWYKIAIQSLIYNDISSNEEMLGKMYENS